MNTENVIQVVLVLFLLLGAGCDGFTMARLDADDDGTTVNLPLGGHVQIRLESNPTTGYGWELAQMDEGMLENTDHQFTGPIVPLPGAGGTEVWEFTTRAAGESVLQLEYVQPWMPDVEPADVFEVTVEVVVGN